MKSVFVAAPLLALGLGACATITRGTSEAFVVESSPSGAQVTTSLGHACEATPCTFAKVKRESEFTVTVSKEGYKSSTHNVTHEMAGGGGTAMAGNVILGGVIGAVLDSNNGSTQNLVPNPLVVTLEPVEAGEARAPVLSRTPAAEPVS